MGVSLSTARYLAPASFIYDFAMQQYAINSTPSMKDVHDANLSFFSPQPYFIAGFFFPQQLFQLAWLYRLWKLDAKDPKQRRDLEEMRRLVPFYVLGNVCIGTWAVFWNASQLKTANLFVVVNSCAQLYYCATQLSPLEKGNWNSILTHVVAKTFAGIGVLDLLHNGSVAYALNQSPSTLVKVLTGVAFAGASSVSDWIFGGCLVYDLVGLAVGQAQYGEVGWSRLLGAYAVGSAAIVGIKNFARPPYVDASEVEGGYEAAAQTDVADRV